VKYIDQTNPVKIPPAVSRCPDCFGVLRVEITEWEPESGEITEAGFEVYCENDELRPDAHQQRFADWHPIENKVYQWLLDNVRIAQATKRHLQAWTEAVKDWHR
jgi:hypothetical protein